MTSRSLALLAALAAARVVAAAAAATTCPPDAVAKVGDATITKDEFDHWLETAAKGAGPGRPGAVVPDPPDFTKCVAAKKKQPVPEGHAKQPDGRRSRSSASSEYDALKRRGHAVPDPGRVGPAGGRRSATSRSPTRRSRRRFEDQKKQAFPKEADYQKFLKTSGMTEDGHPLPREARRAPEQAHAEGSPRTKARSTDEEIEDVLRQEQEALRPARDARPRRGPHQDQGEGRRGQGGARGGAELQATVAKKYSIDEASKAQGGKLPGVAKGQQEKALDDGGLQRQEGRARGPGQDPVRLLRLPGHKITPATQQSLEQVKETIKNLLQSAGPAEGAQRLRQGLPEELQGQDELRRGLRGRGVQERPKEKTDTRPSPAAPPRVATPQAGTPQQAPPPQAPQRGSAGAAPQQAHAAAHSVADGS